MESSVENPCAGLSDSDLNPCQTDLKPCKGDPTPCKSAHPETIRIPRFPALFFPFTPNIFQFFRISRNK